jgi:hypothetical protein
MANFRCERLFIMLDEPVPGVDHIRAVDPVRFAGLFSTDDAEYLDVTPVERFCYAPFDRPRWHPAAKGLATIRALIGLYDKWMSEQPNEDCRYSTEVLQEKIAVLRQVELVLDRADARDRRFYFKMKDLA